MTRFNFRLERVLDLREQTEEQAQRRMAEAQRARSLQERRKEAAETALAEEERSLRRKVSGRFQALDALTTSRFGQKLRGDARREGELLARADELVGDRRRELTEAAKQKKMLELLRDKKRAEHTADLLRLEQAVLDDEAGMRRSRMRESDV